tara:strand:- start:619 stop:1008 length:390 start_codon:yes stop_codon:yes gene_type:complete
LKCAPPKKAVGIARTTLYYSWTFGGALRKWDGGGGVGGGVGRSRRSSWEESEEELRGAEWSGLDLRAARCQKQDKKYIETSCSAFYWGFQNIAGSLFWDTFWRGPMGTVLGGALKTSPKSGDLNSKVIG